MMFSFGLKQEMQFNDVSKDRRIRASGKNMKNIGIFKCLNNCRGNTFCSSTRWTHVSDKSVLTTQIQKDTDYSHHLLFFLLGFHVLLHLHRTNSLPGRFFVIIIIRFEILPIRDLNIMIFFNTTIYSGVWKLF